MQALGYGAPNLRFVEGQIEDLRAAGIEDASIDLVISNCVVRNLNLCHLLRLLWLAPALSIRRGCICTVAVAALRLLLHLLKQWVSPQSAHPPTTCRT